MVDSNQAKKMILERVSKHNKYIKMYNTNTLTTVAIPCHDKSSFTCAAETSQSVETYAVAATWITVSITFINIYSKNGYNSIV